MEPIVEFRPHPRWADSIMSPASVGSVGDVLTTPFLKTSCTDLPRRVDQTFAGVNSEALGSNVQNGDQPSFMSGGLGGYVVDSNWGGNRSFRYANGWKIQDLREPDKLVTPYLAPLGDYSWRNKIARTYESFKTGDLFSDLPGGYEGKGIPRGGQMPRIVDFSVDQSALLKNSFMPETEKKGPLKKSFWETAASNAAAATKVQYTPLTEQQISDFNEGPSKYLKGTPFG